MNKNKETYDGISYNRSALMIVILLGAFCIIMNQTLLITAYPTIMKDLNISLSTVQWLTTLFLLVSGITIPLSAYLMKQIQSKYLFLTALNLFLMGVLICYFGPTFKYLLFGRLLQGIASGIMLPLIQTIVLTLFQKNERGTAMGFVGLVVALAPAIGPTLSGYIITYFNWKTLFLITIPLILLSEIGALLFFKVSIPLKQSKLDIPSVFLSIIGFGSLLYSISLASTKGWLSKEVIVLLFIGCTVIVSFIVRELKISNPLLNLKVFSYSTFSVSVFLSAISYIALLGFESILPDYIQKVHLESPIDSGLILLPGSIVMGLMNPVTGKLFDRFGGRFLIPIGLTLLSLGTFPFLFITETTPILFIAIFYAIRLLGISMVLMPVTTTGMNALPNDMISNGTATNNTLRQIASSFGTAVLVTFLSSHAQATPTQSLAIGSSALAMKESLEVADYRHAFAMAFVFCIVALISSLIIFRKKGSNTKKREKKE
ncbi:MDR family MFS transporter [Enterococcus plantarum]|uniref:MFS transporter n=1 Tax=Enterococcus plantarum TaxID=1077675 RepID=A0A2W3Z350_9ENTE|nr:MDR family MFS transporter [Enterococcus plantarum]PZL74216.1 MFS transporter [Enterococcus plantarum]